MLRLRRCGEGPPAARNAFRTPRCVCCSHAGDSFTFTKDIDGSTTKKWGGFTPGANPVNPPCIAGPCACCDNKDFFITLEKGVPPPKTVAEMER